MADEFFENETDTHIPTEADLAQAYGSKFLSGPDIGDKKIRTKITKLRKEEMIDKDTGKKKIRFVVSFDSIDKPLIINATNKNVLVDALGRNPAAWVGASVGVFFDRDVMFAGKRVGGIRLRVLTPPPPAAAKPAAPPAPKPTPQPAAAAWPEEKENSGFDPDLNDSVPDLSKKSAA